MKFKDDPRTYIREPLPNDGCYYRAARWWTWLKVESEEQLKATRKLLYKDGKYYRWRRGVLVEIPPQWVRKTPQWNVLKKRTSRGRISHKRKVQR